MPHVFVFSVWAHEKALILEISVVIFFLSLIILIWLESEYGMKFLKNIRSRKHSLAVIGSSAPLSQHHVTNS